MEYRVDMKTDYIDYYLIHNISDPERWDTLCELGIERWIAEKKEKGKIKQIGFSFLGSLTGFLGLLDCYVRSFDSSWLNSFYLLERFA